jgi:cytochrome c oxidase assembly factor CtaG
MQWWCSAQGIPWSWEWRPYLGVWLLALVVAAAYWRAYRADRVRGSPTHGAMRRWRIASAAAGVACLWLLLDWPIGTLGSGYLASIHMVQFLGLTLVASPLLLFGIPVGWEAERSPFIAALLERVTSPITALILFNSIVYLTHWPAVSDGLMVTQVGSLAIDLAWICGGLAFWWPVVRGWPRKPLGAAGVPYVVGGMGAHMVLGMFFAITPAPLYRVFELAPPIGVADALGDQQRAGGLMLFGDVVVGLIAIALLVHRWQREETGDNK